MSNIAIQGAATGTGVFTLASPATNTDRTLTLPDEAGTIDTLQRAGNVLQVVQVVKTDAFTTSSTSPTDVTGLSATITPSSSSSKILVMAYVTASSSSSSFSSLLLVRDSTQVFLGDPASSRPRVTAMMFTEGNQGVFGSHAPQFLDTPNTNSPVTYKIQVSVGSGGGFIAVNRSPRDTDSTTYDMRTPSSITLMEIAG